MPQTVEGVMGKDLLGLEIFQSQATIKPDEVYYITLHSKDEREESIKNLKDIADKISQEAKENGLTPKKFGEILGIDQEELNNLM